MLATHRMEVLHESHTGHVRRAALEAARRLGADEGRAGEAAIVATEMATNLVKHGQGGEMLLREIIHRPEDPALELLALDKGPGMSNVSACLRDGYSTAGSAGTGLGAIQRLAGAGRFQIHSAPGQGTAVWVSIPLVRSGPPEYAAGAAASGAGVLECGGVSVPLKGEELCGDAWDFDGDDRGNLRVLVADGLGHGAFAEEASQEAVLVFQQHPRAGPADCLSLMHQALFKTRGAAASMVVIDPEQRRITAAGVGNVVVRALTEAGMKTLTGDSGTLGAAMRRLTEIAQPWEKSSVVILHSDGISSRWGLEKYPGLIRRHPSLIAGVLYRDFRHQHDDATVVVIRQSFSP